MKRGGGLLGRRCRECMLLEDGSGWVILAGRDLGL
jgi:hypothetical protein